VKRKIGEGEEQHTIPVQGSCTEHAEAVKLLSSYAKGVRQSLKARFVERSEVCLKSTGRTSRKVVIGHRYPALLSDSTLPQYEVYKKLVWERGWGGGGESLMRTCMK
jgi:hypothetical protein